MIANERVVLQFSVDSAATDWIEDLRRWPCQVGDESSHLVGTRPSLAPKSFVALCSELALPSDSIGRMQSDHVLQGDLGRVERRSRRVDPIVGIAIGAVVVFVMAAAYPATRSWLGWGSPHRSVGAGLSGLGAGYWTYTVGYAVLGALPVAFFARSHRWQAVSLGYAGVYIPVAVLATFVIGVFDSGAWVPSPTQKSFVGSKRADRARRIPAH